MNAASGVPSSSADRPGAPGSGPPPRVKRPIPVGWVVMVVAGALISLLALAPLLGGGALLWADATQKDDDGFFTTPPERLETTTYAITSDEIDLGADPTSGAGVDLGDIATIRFDVQGVDERSVFVGVGPAREVETYLRDVGVAEVADLSFDPFAVDYDYRDGGAPSAPPGQADVWVASAEGSGEQRLEWEAESGDWAVVIMNADASPGVSVEASLGASSPWVWRVGAILLGVGAIATLIGVTLLVVGVVGLARRSHIDLGASEHHAAGVPVHLEGRLEEPLNRWLWLVKWLLLIPHFIVLAVLWVAFAVVTVVAFFAILFTERYPRALFHFNLGVLRWTWRVSYYGYSALGTDRYPPFSLGPEPDYPATLSVAYPQRLGRGLVLVKWWLLAIPHYLVLSVIAGGAMAGGGRDGWWLASYPAGGFIGLLVFFAAVGLLFLRQYPKGLFDLIMGLNRWVYRVIVYAALMRDDYPPFRLDQGGSEPGPSPVPPSGSPPHGEAMIPDPAPFDPELVPAGPTR